MNRIEEIKQRASKTDNLNDDRADVNYLLSKLETAEKALLRIEDFWEVGITVKTYARDALAELRS